jgi:carbon monoxide dehydrogenase subunit G
MDMHGERHLPAPRLEVWRALNDPEILRSSIPGCRSFEPAGENAYKATAAVKIGPIGADFTGQVNLLNLHPPTSYRIEGSGQGGDAGFAEGSAAVTLTEAGEGTLLTYAVKAEMGGELAQLGAPVIDASAKQIADQFFDNFAAALAAKSSAVAEAPLSLVTPAPAAGNLLRILDADVLGFPAFAWAVAAIYLFLAYNLFGGYL